MNALVMDSIIKAMEKLPNRQEFDVMRTELEKARKAINDVVMPIKRQIEEAIEREAHSDDVYG